MAETTDKTTLAELHKDLRGCFDRLQETGKPLFITAEHSPQAAVLMKVELFDELIEKAELLDSLADIDQSMEDIKAGRVRDFREAIHEIARDLNLKLKS